jgi:sortase A
MQKFKLRSSRRRLGLAIIVTGFALLLHSLWLPAKAELAQFLLARAWTKTLETQQQTPPWPWADHYPVARLIAPSQQIEQIVLAGDSGSVLAFAPGLNMAADSSVTGAKIISAHRDTHFRFLKAVNVDDALVLRTVNELLAYRVTEIHVMNETEFLYPEMNPGGLYLVTCYPFDAMGSASNQRLVVSAVPEPVRKVYNL